MAKVIQNWGIKVGKVANPWGTPPEKVPYYLVGEVEGQKIETRVIGRIGQVFECGNGTSYELGEVHPEYNTHCGGKAKELALRCFNPR